MYVAQVFATKERNKIGFPHAKKALRTNDKFSREFYGKDFVDLIISCILIGWKVCQIENIGYLSFWVWSLFGQSGPAAERKPHRCLSNASLGNSFKKQHEPSIALVFTQFK